MALHNIDSSKWRLTSNSSNASLNDHVAIWISKMGELLEDFLRGDMQHVVWRTQKHLPWTEGQGDPGVMYSSLSYHK